MIWTVQNFNHSRTSVCFPSSSSHVTQARTVHPHKITQHGEFCLFYIAMHVLSFLVDVWEKTQPILWHNPWRVKVHPHLTQSGTCHSFSRIRPSVVFSVCMPAPVTPHLTRINIPTHFNCPDSEVSCVGHPFHPKIASGFPFETLKLILQFHQLCFKMGGPSFSAFWWGNAITFVKTMTEGCHFMRRDGVPSDNDNHLSILVWICLFSRPALMWMWGQSTEVDDDQHQEKKGARFMNFCVNVSLLVRWRPLPYVRRLRSTTTTGICTNCTGDLSSFKAWVKFKICNDTGIFCVLLPFLGAMKVTIWQEIGTHQTARTNLLVQMVTVQITSYLWRRNFLPVLSSQTFVSQSYPGRILYQSEKKRQIFARKLTKNTLA